MTWWQDDLVRRASPEARGPWRRREQRRADQSRRDSRYELRLAISVDCPGEPFAPAVCRNISVGGMFVETNRPAPFGAAVAVFAPLPGLPGLTRIDATVRWTSREGMGVQFGVMGARETHALTELIYGARLAPDPAQKRRSSEGS